MPHELPYQSPASKHGADAVLGLCRLARADAVVRVPGLYRDVCNPYLFHRGGIVGALSLYGYTLVMGLFGLILAMIVNLFLKSTGLRR